MSYLRNCKQIKYRTVKCKQVLLENHAREIEMMIIIREKSNHRIVSILISIYNIKQRFELIKTLAELGV